MNTTKVLLASLKKNELHGFELLRASINRWDKARCEQEFGRLRIAKGYTVAELAREFGKTPATIRGWEDGKLRRKIHIGWFVWLLTLKRRKKLLKVQPRLID